MAKQKSEGAFPDYVKVSEPNFDALALLVAAAQGDRGLNEFARDSGVSSATLSRIINKKMANPCTEAVTLAIAENAAEGSGVTLEALLLAQGYAKVEVDQDDASGKMRLTVGNTDGASLAVSAALAAAGVAFGGATLPASAMVLATGGALGTVIEAAVKSATKSKKVKESEAEQQIREVIQNQLLMRGYGISVSLSENIISGADLKYRADFVIQTNALEADGIHSWAFEINTGKQPLLFKLNQMFGMAYVDSPSVRGIKLSVVTTDREGFSDAKKRMQKLKVHDDISIILVNLNDRKVIEELILQRYDGKERTRVFE